MRRDLKIEFLEWLLKKDEAFLEERRKIEGAATFCCDCGKNTHVGLYPGWHKYQRHLCGVCGSHYLDFLKSFGAIDA